MLDVTATAANGIAIRGESPGLGYGVYGYNPGAFGTGVLGVADATSGTTNGVSGQTASPDGRGVHGLSLSGTGTTYGVRGEVLSSSGFGVFSLGDFGGTGAKYFVQPHPVDPGLQIHFVSLEGNESGTYFRGTGTVSEGVARIAVPEEFRLVTEAEGLTVQLTPVGARASLWLESQDLDEIVVRGDVDVDFHYFVNGVRKGFAELQLVRPNSSFVPAVRGEPFGSQYPEAYRRLLVENGILNADFTPNEATAAKLGWKLLDPGAGEAPAQEP